MTQNTPPDDRLNRPKKQKPSSEKAEPKQSPIQPPAKREKPPEKSYERKGSTDNSRPRRPDRPGRFPTRDEERRSRLEREPEIFEGRRIYNRNEMIHDYQPDNVDVEKPPFPKYEKPEVRKYESPIIKAGCKTFCATNCNNVCLTNCDDFSCNPDNCDPHCACVSVAGCPPECNGVCWGYNCTFYNCPTDTCQTDCAEYSLFCTIYP